MCTQLRRHLVAVGLGTPSIPAIARPGDGPCLRARQKEPALTRGGPRCEDQLAGARCPVSPSAGGVVLRPRLRPTPGSPSLVVPLQALAHLLEWTRCEIRLQDTGPLARSRSALSGPACRKAPRPADRWPGAQAPGHRRVSRAGAQWSAVVRAAVLAGCSLAAGALLGGERLPCLDRRRGSPQLGLGTAYRSTPVLRSGRSLLLFRVPLLLLGTRPPLLRHRALPPSLS